MYSVTHQDLHGKLLSGLLLALLLWLPVSPPLAHAVDLDPSASATTADTIEVAAVRRSNESDLALSERVKQSYEKMRSALMANRSWSGFNDRQARQIFEVANAASFYTGDSRITEDQVKALAALERFHASQPHDVVQTYRALLAARDFAAAKGFFAHHADGLPHPPPEVVEPIAVAAGLPSELRIAPHGRRLLHVASHIDAGRLIIVVADPLCPYTQRAMAAIGQDPALNAVMRSHSKWIAPPSRQDDFSVFAAWNERYPQQQMSLAFRKSDWPMLTQWATPIFYFMDAGRVIDTVAGWPAQGHRAELLAAAKRIGLQVSEDQVETEPDGKR
ncbi:hypothetical protein HG421_18275 [Xanthomonas campestris pv. badrii]|uniref:Thioredoxin domain-containing protein n=1 Tax=Xanthomonas campestris pv. badrii TaxID=149696 RepID=A0A7Z2ZIK0_XANCA|nr:hypothetical protein [Xanthomonas campestris]QJD69451.1 hypothetical protein HG421_18275 [Xanthomonas campestris pv. badrii]